MNLRDGLHQPRSQLDYIPMYVPKMMSHCILMCLSECCHMAWPCALTMIRTLGMPGIRWLHGNEHPAAVCDPHLSCTATAGTPSRADTYTSAGASPARSVLSNGSHSPDEQGWRAEQADTPPSPLPAMQAPPEPSHHSSTPFRRAQQPPGAKLARTELQRPAQGSDTVTRRPHDADTSAPSTPSQRLELLQSESPDAPAASRQQHAAAAAPDAGPASPAAAAEPGRSPIPAAEAQQAAARGSASGPSANGGDIQHGEPPMDGPMHFGSSGACRSACARSKPRRLLSATACRASDR